MLPTGAVKVLRTKLFHFNAFRMAFPFMVSPFSEITADKGARFKAGKNFKMRDGAKIRVRRNAEIVIGAGCVFQGEYGDNPIISRRTDGNSVCKI